MSAFHKAALKRNHLIILILGIVALGGQGTAAAAPAAPVNQPALKISGRWKISQTNGVKAVWRFNKDCTYNYWDQTGKFSFKNNKYRLQHTWDWDVKMLNDNTFEGVCIRGDKGCKIHGSRLSEALPAKIAGKWNIDQSNGVNAEWSFNDDYTYNYWNKTGLFREENETYYLYCTWDWEITMPDANTFEGVCTRGEIGCTIRGTRVTP